MSRIHSFTRIILPVAIVVLTISPGRPEETVSADSLFQLATTAGENEDYDEAAKLMEKALELDPDNCEFHFVLGDIQGARAQEASIFTKLSKAGSCKKHWELAVEHCPDSVKYLSALMQYHLAAPGLAGGSKEEAERLLERIFALDSVEGFWNSASLAIRNEDYAQAEETYFLMLEACMDTVDVLRGLGHLYNLRLEEHGRARPYYLRVLAAEPEDWGVVYQVGRIAVLENEHTREAIDRFTEYVSHPEAPGRPDHAGAYWRMGMAYEQLGDLDSARTCYESALEQNSKFKQAKKSLKKLNKRD